MDVGRTRRTKQGSLRYGSSFRYGIIECMTKNIAVFNDIAIIPKMTETFLSPEDQNQESLPAANIDG